MPLNKVSLHKGAFAWSWHCAVGNGAAMAQVGNHLAPRTGGKRGACRGQEADHVGEGTSHHSDATGLRAGKASEEDQPSLGSFRRRSRNPARVHRNDTEVGAEGDGPRTPSGAAAGRGGNAVTGPSPLSACVRSPGLVRIYVICKPLFKLTTTRMIILKNLIKVQHSETMVGDTRKHFPLPQPHPSVPSPEGTTGDYLCICSYCAGILHTC